MHNANMTPADYLVRAENNLAYLREQARQLKGYEWSNYQRHIAGAERTAKYYREWVETGEQPFQYVLLRCPAKGCKYTVRIKVGLHLGHTGKLELQGSAIYTERIKGCPEHGGYLRAQVVEGTHKESVPCDARCISARGRICECSCGGQNHGAAYD